MIKHTSMKAQTPSGATRVPVIVAGQLPSGTINTQQLGKSVAEKIAALPPLTVQPNPSGKPAEWQVWSQLRAVRLAGLIRIASEMDSASLKAALEHAGRYEVSPDGFVQKLVGEDTGLGYFIDQRRGACGCKRGKDVALIRREMEAAGCSTSCRCIHDHLREWAGLRLSLLLEQAQVQEGSAS